MRETWCHPHHQCRSCQIGHVGGRAFWSWSCWRRPPQQSKQGIGDLSQVPCHSSKSRASVSEGRSIPCTPQRSIPSFLHGRILVPPWRTLPGNIGHPFHGKASQVLMGILHHAQRQLGGLWGLHLCSVGSGSYNRLPVPLGRSHITRAW